MRTRRSLIDLDDLSGDEIRQIFDRTHEFEEKLPGRLLEGIAVVNVFFENSTRTLTSFNLAELRLGADVVNLSPDDLSLANKGETIEDTVLTFGAMGVSAIVVRHPEPGYPNRMASSFDGHVINAGDGAHAHPTQALLDIYTLRKEFGAVDGLRVAIVGDVLHSRVAHSTIAGLRRLGAEVVLVGPDFFLPSTYEAAEVCVERSLDAVLGSVDAIILLRIQRERFAAMPMNDSDYVTQYQLNGERLKNVPEKTIIMHPGPFNRGMELDDTVLQFAGWRYALQVHHGVYIRMAVLDFFINGAPYRA
ncbi:MAG: aspartate carbamoyltransferase catalytic subunit [Candidatus Eremiobacteraeota bacterium]|nr:aspartate carbamoyltransferase catalytic subunit [Candidatus Eremiobacteraeota bacterium]